MTFVLEAMSGAASTHLGSLILLRSMTVPTVTVKGLRHSLHLCTPGRVDLPLSLVMRSGSALPQIGQTGPLGHNRHSKCSRAASQSVKIGVVRSTLVLLLTHYFVWCKNMIK